MSGTMDELEAEIAELEKGQAEEPEPQPAPEPAPQAAQQPEPETPEADANRARAWEEERRERKRLQKELDERQREYERQMAVMADRLERIQQAQAAPPQLEPAAELPEYVKKGKPTVSFDDDAAEYFRQKEEIDDYRYRAISEDVQQRRQQTEAQQRHEQLITAIRADEYRFQQEHPDYLDALKHLQRSRTEELIAIGLSLDQAMQRVAAEELQVAATAFQTRRRPSEVAYELSKLRGYAAASTHAPSPTGGAPAPAAAASAPPIDRLMAGATESRTLGAAGSGTGAGKLTPQALLSMSEDEFSAALAKMTKAEQRAMMGA